MLSLCLCDRNLSKKAPKTEKRAEAYNDFVVYFIAGAPSVNEELLPNSSYVLNEIKSRLILFGESNVVNAAAFLNKHQTLDNKFQEAFCNVVREMRKSVRTGIAQGTNEKV